MSKQKIILITLVGNNNYGNKLQHYATQKIFSKKNISIKTLRTNRMTVVKKIKNKIKSFTRKRFRNFYIFDKKIHYINSAKNIDYCIIGSDQVWNTNFKTFKAENLGKNIDCTKKISFSSSFGTDLLDEEYKPSFKEELSNFNHISVREDSGKKIIEDLTGRKDVEVLIDPTMLLIAEEWDEISKKPKQLKTKKYILSYFLGDQSESRRKEIEKIAKENNCQIINILDKNDPFYTCGPSEFLYLEKHAFLICTDSFHSSVFAILYNRPFVVFEREQKGIANMNSRLDTLINKFKLKNRRYNGINITNENLNHDYSEAYKILEMERKKSIDFLNKAMKD